jgi:hypothetical protein
VQVAFTAMSDSAKHIICDDVLVIPNQFGEAVFF